MNKVASLANPEYEWGYPPGIEYYFDTSSGRAYSEVDHVFTTNGLGTTRSPYVYAGTDQRVHTYSRIHNNAELIVMFIKM